MIKCEKIRFATSILILLALVWNATAQIPRLNNIIQSITGQNVRSVVPNIALGPTPRAASGPRAKLRWMPEFVAPLNQEKFKYVREAFVQAMNAYSELIQEDITLRVRITSKPVHLATAQPALRFVQTAEFVPLLEQRLKATGISGIRFPRQGALLNALKHPTIKASTLMTLPAPIGKVVLTSNVFFQVFGTKEPDIVVTVNTDFNRWNLDMAAITVNNKVSMFTAFLHEIGHGLGFYSTSGWTVKEGDSWGPAPLDLYQFRPGQSIQFSLTPRFFGAGAVFSDGRPVEGRVPYPPFDQGGGHWKPNYNEKTRVRSFFLGVMDQGGDPVGSIPYSFSLPDLTVISRLGYRVNYVPKPILLNLWRKPMKSGTYHGVAAHLLVAPQIEFLFAVDTGARFVLTTFPSARMRLQDMNRDINQFMDRRRNFFAPFKWNPSEALPELAAGQQWRVYARNKMGSTYGAWSNPLAFNGRWDTIHIPDDHFGWETSMPGSTFLSARVTKPKIYPDVRASIQPDPHLNRFPQRKL